VHCTDDKKVVCYKDALIGVGGYASGVNGGKILFVEPDANSPSAVERCSADGVTVRVLGEKQFLIPGFIDAHAHAPQCVLYNTHIHILLMLFIRYSFLSLGSNLTLMDWLNTYTFNYESKFAELKWARNVYERVVHRTLMNGTTTACYFATIHLKASELLFDVMNTFGQRGFVGKVNMDRNSPPHYVEESADVSVKRTHEFIDYCLSKNSSIVKPIITPRFVPTCTVPLMQQLASISAQYDLPIQSHVSESLGEISFVTQLHPKSSSYTAVYDENSLLTPRTILAHGIHLTDAEIDLVRQRGSAIIHCPTSNFNLSSGVCPVRRLINHGITVGMGTDISGGYSPSMLAAIRDTITASQVCHFAAVSANGTCGTATPPTDALTYEDAFYLATLGSATALRINNKVGNFVAGKEFDAVLVDLGQQNGPIDCFGFENTEQMFQKFLFTGDDRCIKEVYVQGKRVIG